MLNNLSYEFNKSILIGEVNELVDVVNDYDFTQVYNFTIIYDECSILICCKNEMIDINIVGSDDFIFNNHEILFNFKTAILMEII